jgi:hypothetical protein
MCGPPCSGKTTAAAALALELGAVRLAPDQWIAVLGLDQRMPLRDSIDLLTEAELLGWHDFFEPPSAEELALFDPPTLPIRSDR